MDGVSAPATRILCGVAHGNLEVPRLSVIVAAWNAAESIGNAVSSVLAQPDVPLECIVVDDGSTDKTAAIVEAMAARDARIVLIRSPGNEGVSAARNRGLRAARGEWLTFLDVDDRILPGGIAALMRATRETDPLAVVGQRVWSDGERTWISERYDRPDIRKPGRKSLVHNPGLMYYASATGKLFHRSLTSDLWFEGRVLGDQPWTIRALLRAGDRIEVIADSVYQWSRPRRGHEFASITAAKHGSARLAAGAVVVARGALRQVSDEADRVLVDPETRRTVVAGYFDRLVSADFSGPVSRALARRDEGTAELFASIGAFLAAAPPDVVAGSDALVDCVLRPPLERWWKLGPAGRAAYRSMIHQLLAAHPALAEQLDRRRLLRPAIRLAHGTGGPRAGATADALLVPTSALLTLASLPGRLARRIRRR